MVHVSTGKSMFVYDPKADEIVFREMSDHFWRQDDCWLLIDGEANAVPFSEKRSRGIVFASPKKKNYHEFVKESGKTFYMPPWEKYEISRFIKCMPKKIAETLSNSLKAKLEAPSETYKIPFVSSIAMDIKPVSPLVKTITSTLPPTSSEAASGAHSAAVESSDGGKSKTDAYDHLVKVAERRYTIVGGNVRLLFSLSLSDEALKKAIYIALHEIPIQQLKDIFNLNISGTIPSILYSIRVPCDNMNLIYAGESEPPEGSDDDDKKLQSNQIDASKKMDIDVHPVMLDTVSAVDSSNFGLSGQAPKKVIDKTGKYIF